MTRSALLLGLALLTAACGDKQPATANDAVADAGLEQEDVIANDVTAIDAATADDAKMAADVPAPIGGDLGNAADKGADKGTKSEKKASAPGKSDNEPAPAADNAAEPGDNAA
ncbi:hypothetical protein [Sphingomonas astaxanthinifaciens]|uniref:Uncharacterized protein n=1 Tax=Sphingomonas astaxanthinifaciens DSM 22298 TaxID=1123267 RepID=A0ABQ5Z5Q4_9SPHN|nr:hypothetical protein [Sphingomonas astaxanthinifaciens]GLR47355.1 hypothetical protein GCM10007925_10660 [Sphingomonas astaxanthinifaciens DSM 22298]